MYWVSMPELRAGADPGADMACCEMRQSTASNGAKRFTKRFLVSKGLMGDGDRSGQEPDIMPAPARCGGGCADTPLEPIKRAFRRQKAHVVSRRIVPTRAGPPRSPELDPPCRRGYHRAVDANATLASALAAYRAGRPADARRTAEELWRGAGDALAAGLLALLELDAGRFAQA